jgi:GNAT superfamily N-acetyltransferase
MQIRLASQRDVDAVAETIALAFSDDPVWGPALAADDGSTGHLVPFWRYLVENAVQHRTVFVQDGPSKRVATVAVWLPSGVEELTDEQAGAVDALIAGVLSPTHLAAYERLWGQFEEGHPHEPAHMYLSLLATHPDDRGQGIGQQLLAENLARWDAQGLPSYLESTNPANDHRYERAGFRPIGRFYAVLDDAPVTRMWREPRPA